MLTAYSQLISPPSAVDDEKLKDLKLEGIIAISETLTETCHSELTTVSAAHSIGVAHKQCLEENLKPDEPEVLPESRRESGAHGFVFHSLMEHFSACEEAYDRLYNDGVKIGTRTDKGYGIDKAALAEFNVKFLNRHSKMPSKATETSSLIPMRH